jgi:hypothetical protein
MQRLHPPSRVEGPSLRTDGGDKGYLQKAALDRNRRLTPQERSDGLQRRTDALDRQAQSVGLARAIEAGMELGGGPLPPAASEGGLTPPALRGERQGASQRLPWSAGLVADGDKADRDRDGEISFQEAKAFYAASEEPAAALGADARIGTPAPTGAPIEAHVLIKIMQLVHAYRLCGEDGPAGGVSISA